MQETFYFGAGPATLPKTVLTKIAQELVDYQGTGLSVLEMSHRSDAFLEILDDAESLLRALMGIPDDYAVLFLHGGATAQYSMLPLKFLHSGASADYVCTGHWSSKACEEAKIFADVNAIDALNESDSIAVKSFEKWSLEEKSVYIHYCDNETINGVVNDIAGMEGLKSKSEKLFCDMTSSILTRPIQVKNYGLLYASAQKNLGVAGLCVMTIKKELLEKTNKSNIPRIYDFKRCMDNKSLVNTPPTFAIYVLGLMLNWLKAEGGVEEMHKRGRTAAEDIYTMIDASEIYKNKVCAKDRSNVNIPFVIKDKVMQAKFLQQAEGHKLLGLRGHKSVGGVRISMYNAMPRSGVDKLLEFMREFECNHAAVL